MAAFDGAGARVPVWYWPRLAFGLFTSVLGTVLTLPERVALGPVLWLLSRRSGATLKHGPGVVVILGYYRSGTTHLHYLMSCDPRMRSPTWCETLAPQGFILSWAFLRVFMIPFVSATRPQDDVAIGPEWPAEDDFAVNNWTLCSALPGRFVLPRTHGFFDRFHFLRGLSAAEVARWRWTQWAFCWKVSVIARKRRLLLKTPSHTARVAALTELFGGNVKFVHISREPGAVVKSNVNMASRLGVYALGDRDEGDDVRGRIEREYVETERKFLEEAKGLGPGMLAEMRYEDLVADPMGELERVYGELGISWDDEFQRRALAYLASVREYRAATPGKAGERATEMKPEVAELARRFGHDRPARAGVELPVGVVAETQARAMTALVAGLGVALTCFVLWVAQAWVLRDRHDWLAWPVGVLIGWSMIKRARVGSALLGWNAAALTFLVFVAIACPATFLMDYAHRTSPIDYRGLPMRDWEWYHILKASRAGFLAWNNLFWGFMGCVTAYRFASRELVNPPGTG